MDKSVSSQSDTAAALSSHNGLRPDRSRSAVQLPHRECLGDFRRGRSGEVVEHNKRKRVGADELIRIWR
jgi:hypothetical protein